MVKELPINSIVPDPSQPRKTFDETKLQELAESITQHGLLQPILVRPLQKGKFQIVHGERRWRACKLIGKPTILAEIGNLNEKQALEIQLIENLEREDLNCMEEADTFQRMITELGYTHKILSKRIGKSRAYITNKLRLLKLSPKIQEQLKRGMLSEGHAKVIVSLKEADRQETVVKEIMDKNLTVRETEQIIRNFKNSEVLHGTLFTQNKTFLIPVSSELYFLLKKVTKKTKIKIEVIIEQATRTFLKNKGFSDGVD